MAMKQILTQSRLKELLSYDLETGIFTWKSRVCNVRSGSIAGRIMNNCYRIIGIDRAEYLAHRLAFLYVNGAWPAEQVDHINHICDDNRWTNLRLCSHKQNAKNKAMSPSNTSGVTGVVWHKKACAWQAQISVSINLERKCMYLGTHSNFFDAVAARKSAELKYGFHPNHGKP